eukprot:5955878-Pleurochrysis_carterae.AAC.1
MDFSMARAGVRSGKRAGGRLWLPCRALARPLCAARRRRGRRAACNRTQPVLRCKQGCARSPGDSSSLVRCSGQTNKCT